MAKSGGKDYFGLSWIVSLILCIIPITSWILGFVTRFKEGAWIAGIIRVIPFCGLIIWILDLVFMITKGEIFRLEVLNAKKD